LHEVAGQDYDAFATSLLIESKADVTQRDGDGRTVLNILCDATQSSLDQEDAAARSAVLGILINTVQGKQSVLDGYFLNAMKAGCDIAEARSWINMGASVQALDESGNSAFEFTEDPQVLELLVFTGANHSLTLAHSLDYRKVCSVCAV
jgi:hypothetical protein